MGSESVQLNRLFIKEGCSVIEVSLYREESYLQFSLDYSIPKIQQNDRNPQNCIASTQNKTYDLYNSI